MRDSYFIKFFKYVISIRLTRSDDREKEENDNLRFREQIGENIKIQVDDETPDFLKIQNRTFLLLKLNQKLKTKGKLRKKIRA